MKYKLYTKSKKAWDSMLTEINKAEKSILIEIYIFSPDTKESHDFLGILKRKAEAGVRVIIVADSFGSAELKNEIDSLEKSGIELIFFSHWLRHIHRKICILDDKVAFIGGVNIGKKFENWDDLQLKLHGKKLIRRILKSFAYTYEMAGGEKRDILLMRKQKISYKLKFWLVEHLPQKNIHTLRRSYEEKISKAQKDITIATPYFAPPRWLISLLDNAIKRGVTVNIIVPQKIDLFFANRVNMHYIEKLHSLGIKFYMVKEMNHSKLLIIDNDEALIGSQNLDPISFSLNMEAGIFFRDRKLVRDLLQAISNWKNNSIVFEPRKNTKIFVDYLITIIVKIFYPIL